MSDDSSNRTMRHTSLLGSGAANSAGVFGGLHRRRFQGSLNVLHIRLAPRFTDSSHSTQTHSPDSSNDPRKPKKDFGSPPRVIGTLFIAFIASQLIALFLTAFFLGAIGATTNIEDSASAQFTYVLLAEGIAVGIVYLFLRRRRLGFADIGLGRRPQWRDLKVAVAGFFAFYALLIIVTITVKALIPSFDVDQAQDVGFKNLQTSLDRVIAFAALVILPPIGEEILMRGYLYTGLRSRLRFIWALAITSVIFGLAHLEYGKNEPVVWVAGLSTFILSVVLVYTRERTGALYAAILIHAANNAIAFSLNF